jgi:ATP-dependent DNA helicase RecG
MSILSPLFHPITHLKGVGPEMAKAAKRIIRPARGGETLSSEAIPTIRDMLLHLPIRYEDRRQITPITDLKDGHIATVKASILEHTPPKIRKGRYGRPLPYRIWIEDDSHQRMQLVFFHQHHDYLSKLMPVGAQRVVSGRVTVNDGVATMAHPDYMLPLHRAHEACRIVPIYPAGKGFSSKQIAKLMPLALGHLSPSLPEWLSETSIDRLSATSFYQSLCAIHQPKTMLEDITSSPAWRRLAYDELLAHQLTLRIGRSENEQPPSHPMRWDTAIEKKLLSELPFHLTASQREVLEAIRADAQAGKRLHRLIQGDVGSGKTIIAMLAMIQAVNAGHQAILMAPTDILARQHMQSLAPLADSLDMRMVYLSGKMRKKEQDEVRARIASGEAHIVVGTHAVFQQAVQYDSLAMVVIDEQQRFGVTQRMALSEKGQAPHLIQLSATPIPRSLMMTYYGDMDVSVLAEKPPGRQPIETHIIPLSRQDEVIAGLKRRMDAGEKIYWVCPLIEPNEADEEKAADETASAEDRAKVLARHFPEKVGLVHGRLKPAEREKIMHAFAFGDLQCLVATTVIEVGVNVPQATVMVVEAAERFGLSQLHQLRGRVGRGSDASHCILLYHTPISEYGKKRLKLLRETEDGFKIAEEDLRLRGAGDVLGTRQTGMPEFSFADIVAHADMLRMARDDAEMVLNQDPSLLSERGRHLRILLEFWGYNHAMARLHAA